MQFEAAAVSNKSYIVSKAMPSIVLLDVCLCVYVLCVYVVCVCARARACTCVYVSYMYVNQS